MDAVEWQRVKDIFSSALERPAAERPAFLAEACGGDESLREQVESLLAEYEQFASSAPQTTPSVASAKSSEKSAGSPECDSVSGRRLGAYRLLRRLGQGGMATVYLAVRADDQFRKTVAIKMVPAGHDNDALIRRFRNERQTMAALDHPNIVKLLDAGTTEDGLPFLVMDYVEGTRLDRYCDHHKLSINERLQLFRKVCDAVNYAHQRLIIHRDLKPSNILVTADGTPKLLDFGIAKLMNPEAAATLVLTGTGQRLMTPEYASPEQVRGEPLTNATDVYSLGVVLYELLTGHRPVRVKSRTMMEIERAICEEEPSKPSTIVTRRFEQTTAEGRTIAVTPEDVSRTRGGDPKKLSSKLHGDLDAAVMMALRKEPQRRYASVHEYSADIGRYLEGLPIKARPNNIGYRTTKYVRRHKDAAIATSVVLLLGGAVLVGSVLYSRHFQMQIAGAPTEKTAAALPTASTLAAEKHGWHETEMPAELVMPDLFGVGADYGSPQLVLFGQSSLVVWKPGQAVSSSQPIGFPIVGRADCGSEVWLVHDDRRRITMWDITKQQPSKTITAPSRVRSGTCIGKESERWAFLTADLDFPRLIEFNAARNQTLQSTPVDKSYFDVALDDQARNLVLIGSNSISVRSREHSTEIVHDTPPEALFRAARRWSPSGRYLALGFKQLLIYDVEQKKRINTLPTKGWLNDIGWVGDKAVSAMDDRGRLYWTSDLSKGWEFTQEPAVESTYRSFWDSTNLRWLAADNNGRMRLLSYGSPSALFSIPVGTLESWSIASNPADAIVAVAGKDPNIHIVDVREKRIVQTLEGHTDGVTFVRFDSLHRLISASDDGTLRVWDPNKGKLLQTVSAHRSLINAFAISPDGKWLISVSSDKSIKLWQFPDLALIKDLGTTNRSGAAVAFLGGDNRRFLVSDWSGRLYMYDGDAPNWRLHQQFQLATNEVYMVCPTRAGWWAALPNGSKAGLWKIPADEIQRAVQVSNIPTVYCSTSDDGLTTAAMRATGIEVLSNSTGQQEAVYYFANESVTIAIQQRLPMVLTEAGGNLVAWPLPAQE
jgi:serine/threonine protein kinase/WD40 repeat protein